MILSGHEKGRPTPLRLQTRVRPGGQQARDNPRVSILAGDVERRVTESHRLIYASTGGEKNLDDVLVPIFTRGVEGRLPPLVGIILEEIENIKNMVDVGCCSFE